MYWVSLQPGSFEMSHLCTAVTLLGTSALGCNTTTPLTLQAGTKDDGSVLDFEEIDGAENSGAQRILTILALPLFYVGMRPVGVHAHVSGTPYTF